MNVTDYYHLVAEYEERYNVDCLSLEYVIAYEKSIDHPTPEAFIRLVLKNAALDQIRRRNNSVTFTDYLKSKQRTGSDEAFLGAESKSDLLESRASVPEDTSLDFYDAAETYPKFLTLFAAEQIAFDQRVLDLRLMDYSLEEIATELKVKFHTVTNSIVRIQKHLRTIYELDI